MMHGDDQQADQFVMLQARAWIDAVIVSGERLLRGTTERQGQESRFRRQWEQEVFVFAAMKLARWAFLARIRGTAPPTAFKALSALEPAIKAAHDLYQSADEYVGVGDRSIPKPGAKVPQAPASLPAEAMMSLVVEGELMVAGKLSASKVVEAARAAQSEFEAIAANSQQLRWLVA